MGRCRPKAENLILGRTSALLGVTKAASLFDTMSGRAHYHLQKFKYGECKALSPTDRQEFIQGHTVALPISRPSTQLHKCIPWRPSSGGNAKRTPQHVFYSTDASCTSTRESRKSFFGFADNQQHITLNFVSYLQIMALVLEEGDVQPNQQVHEWEHFSLLWFRCLGEFESFKH